MSIHLSNEEMQLVTEFTNITGTSAVDVLDAKDSFVFVVSKGSLGKAIGKQGSMLEKLRNAFNKNVELVEESDNIQGFLTNFFRGIVFQKIDEKNSEGKIILRLHVPIDQKGKAIGRGGEKINKARALLKRHFGVSEFQIT